MRLSKNENLRAAVIGRDGRTSAIIDLLERSPRVSGQVEVLSDGKGRSPQAMLSAVLEKAKTLKPDFVVIGPEEPLAHGAVDVLEGIGIPCVGPTKALSKLETSKAFTRSLLSSYRIQGNPEFQVFTATEGVQDYLRSIGEFVIKPDGLSGGKGVKVSGDHLGSIDEGVRYCQELFDGGQSQIVIEEKLDGEEFSLQSLCDGSNVVHTVVVQDHKRANDGDKGPNTGGMGTYSDANHSLPFLERSALEEARTINERVASAVRSETGKKYKGVLFGGFMLTRSGVRLLEYNARFGDPEALNVLSLLQADFADVCLRIINENLEPIGFEKRATVCKYVVPNGYPECPVKGEIDLSRVPAESSNLRVFRASIQPKPNGLYELTGSRAVAFVGIGNDLKEAYEHAENAAASVDGPVFHRVDIGSAQLVEQRVRHMNAVRHKVAV